MRIGLIDVDSHNFPNLCLMKLAAYHRQQGDQVEWYNSECHYDIVYQSKVFDDTYSKDIDFIPNATQVIRGGTGYGLDQNMGKLVDTGTVQDLVWGYNFASMFLLMVTLTLNLLAYHTYKKKF